MIMKRGLYIIGICAIFLFCPNAGSAADEDYAKNIDDVESYIKFDHEVCPPVAYLYIELKNNGDKKISNLTLEIKYCDVGGNEMERAVLKNALTEPLPAGESRKYKIRLKGDVVYSRSAQYPYSRANEVDDFDIKITKINFAKK